MALVAIFLIYTIATLIYLYMTRNYNHWKNKGIAYIKPTPIIGNFLQCFLMRITIGEFLENIYNSSKEDVVGMFVFDRPYLMIRSPEMVKSVLVSDFNVFNNRAIADNEKSDPIGANILFIIKNPEWRKLRQKISPVFSSGKLKTMLPLINTVGEDMVTYILENALNKGSVDIKEITAKYSTDVIASCAFGLNANSFVYENAEFREAGKQVFGFGSWSRAIHMGAYFFSPLAVKLFGLKFYHPEAADFMRTVFLKTTEERKKTKLKRNDLIDILMEIKEKDDQNTGCKPLEGDCLVAQAAVFFGAGFESTSTTTAAAVFELCQQPDLQTRLRKEIRSTLAKHNGEITLESVNDMKYLHMVVSETLRKYPVLPFLDRRAMEDYTIPGTNTVIEKGTPVFIPLFGLHYDPNLFPDPHKFDPERFSKENQQNIVPYSYLPFGVGPHYCIGERFGWMAVKIGIIRILSQFIVEKTSKTVYPIALDPKGFLLTPKGGFHVSLRKYEE